MKETLKPLVLIILDGWGYREESKHNAILTARTPTWDELWQKYPHTLVAGSGNAVGLPQNQMGNSEVGHLTMGAGRLVYQEYTRIDKAIEDGEFFSNPVLLAATQKVRDTNKALHILGLLSPGGVHSHESQIHAMLELAAQQNLEKVYVHAFLDGRDTPPKSAMASLNALETKLKRLEQGKIVSLIGRYYAMDRDQRWDRTQKAYDLLIHGKADYQADTAIQGLQKAYERGESDEFVQATAIHDPSQPPLTIDDGDVVIFMNYRADRARQLTRAFTELDFTGFQRAAMPKLADFITLTQYAVDIKARIAFPPQSLNNVLGEYIAKLGLNQLRIAETEKYAHVTFFFNGGQEKPFRGEDRILVPSQKVATYDLKPEMSANEVTEQLVKAIHSNKYALMICNFANPDMVGHTGNFKATVLAIEVIDQCLNRIMTALQETGGEAIITADHGNAEIMYDENTQQPLTSHTTLPVPFVYIGRSATISHNQGTLADIAPTILYVMGLPKPEEMSGESLINWNL